MHLACFFVLLFSVAFLACGSRLEEVLRSELMKKIEDKSKELELPEHKIVGGWSATSGLVPYQAVIRGFTYEGETLCGGSLITRRHVLTAAHCLISTLGAIVVLGSSNKNMLFGAGIRTFLVDGENFVLHPDYDDDELQNDIAILRLPGSIMPFFTIRPISLPNSEMTATDYFAGMHAIIAGFGKTTDDFWDIGSDKLQMSYVNITKLEDCQRFWRRRVVAVSSSQVCTKFNGSGPCKGDSGGPLAVTIDSKQYLVGITSFGYSRCLRPSPSVYTNVASYLDWIRSVVALK